MPLQVTEIQPVDPETDILKRRLLELYRQKKDILSSNPLRYYRPHPKQQKFHEHGDKKFRACFAGNRFGKSQMGVAEDVAWLLGYRPWVPEGSPFRTLGIPQRPVKILVITTDWDMVDKVFTSDRGEMGKIWRMLPKGIKVRKKRNHAGVISEIEIENGSTITFSTVKSFATNPQGEESTDWDGIHIDEPCSHDQWKAASRGLIDRGGKAWFTLTPLREPWIYDMFFNRDDFDKLAEGMMSDKLFAISGNTYDNIYLLPEDIADFETSLSEDERQCRIEGIPLELSGMVYKEFRYDRHVYSKCPFGWDAMDSPPEWYPITVSIDPHPQTPTAVLFEAAGPDGTLYFFDEIFQKDTVENICAEIKRRVSRYKSVKFIADPSAFNEHAMTNECLARDFQRCGIPIRKSSKQLSQGLLRTKQELSITYKGNPVRDHAFDMEAPRLVFSAHLRRTIYEFRHYVWDEKENKPKDKDDHLMECMYRILLENPRFFDPRKPQPPITEAEAIGAFALSFSH